MKYRPKDIQYPTYHEEFRIVTPSGAVSCVFEKQDEPLARARFALAFPGWKLVRVTILQEVVATQPCCHREIHQPHLSLVPASLRVA